MLTLKIMKCKIMEVFYGSMAYIAEKIIYLLGGKL